MSVHRCIIIFRQRARPSYILKFDKKFENYFEISVVSSFCDILLENHKLAAQSRRLLLKLLDSNESFMILKSFDYDMDYDFSFK